MREVIISAPSAFFPRFGQNLRRLRKLHQLSIGETAHQVGISKTYLWELEQDRGAKSPSAWVVLQLSKHLGTTMACLLGVTEPATGARLCAPGGEEVAL